DADAPHTKRRDVAYGEVRRPAHEQVDRLGRDRLDHGRYLLARPDAGRVEAVRARVRVGDEAGDRVVEIGTALQEAFSPAGEPHVGAGAVDRRARRAHTRDRVVELIERLLVVAGRILDREPGNARGDAQPHALRNTLGLVRKAVLEIRVHRHVRGGDDLGE